MTSVDKSKLVKTHTSLIIPATVVTRLVTNMFEYWKYMDRCQKTSAVVYIVLILLIIVTTIILLLLGVRINSAATTTTSPSTGKDDHTQWAIIGGCGAGALVLIMIGSYVAIRGRRSSRAADPPRTDLNAEYGD